MSRSRRNNPICGWTTARSEKEDKRIANRISRRTPVTEKPQIRAVSDIWAFAKDGKQRFDPAEYPKLMRK
jgi:hypothetical protein